MCNLFVSDSAGPTPGFLRPATQPSLWPGQASSLSLSSLTPTAHRGCALPATPFSTSSLSCVRVCRDEMQGRQMLYPCAASRSVSLRLTNPRRPPTVIKPSLGTASAEPTARLPQESGSFSHLSPSVLHSKTIQCLRVSRMRFLNSRLEIRTLKTKNSMESLKEKT